MTNDVVERVARAICACSCLVAKAAGVCPGCTQWDDTEAKVALAALKPGDDLPNGLHVETSQFWRGVSDENNMLVARRAAEEMRERSADMVERLGEAIDRRPETIPLKQIAVAIRALPVEPDHD